MIPKICLSCDCAECDSSCHESQPHCYTPTLLRAEAAVSDSDWIMVDGRIFRCSIKACMASAPHPVCLRLGMQLPEQMDTNRGGAQKNSAKSSH